MRCGLCSACTPLHHRVDLTGLDVGDAHVHAAGQLDQFEAQVARAEVLADVGHLSLVVAEGGLDDQMRQPQFGQALATAPDWGRCRR